MALTIKDKAKVFTENLEPNCIPNYVNVHAQHTGAVDLNIQEIFSREDDSVIPSATPERVREILRKFRSRKAPEIERSHTRS